MKSYKKHRKIFKEMSLVFTETIRRFLEEHSRFENLPRKSCPDCSFEYNAEQEPHVCRPNPFLKG